MSLDMSNSVALNTNILFITLDSCRYDSACNASLVTLPKVGKLMKAETSGSFTYPAHHSFFIGNLPRLIDSSFYFKTYEQIWRSGNARDSSRNIFLTFETKNIIDFYLSQNFNVSGFGGVSFFNNSKKSNILPSLFPRFHYFNNTENTSLEEKVPRKLHNLTFSHVDEIAKEFTKDQRFMVFINANETHIPYDTPKLEYDEFYRDTVIDLYQEHYSQELYQVDKLPLDKKQLQILKDAQISALEWTDQKIGELISKIPETSPTLIIVCGDHGDEFGEGGRFGHAHVHETVMTVPIWVGLINEQV